MTFSIVARDARSGAIGVATATGGPVVGSLVPYAMAAIGGVATQGYTTNPHYGFEGLDLMARGASADEVVQNLTAADSGRARRQCVMIDAMGRTAAWTGNEISKVHGSITRPGVAVAGNTLGSFDVLGEMIAAFDRDGTISMADRLLAALVAAEMAGGDRRGTRSAAIKVYDQERYPCVDIRVDWSQTPVDELRQVLEATRADDYATFFLRLPSKAFPERS